MPEDDKPEDKKPTLEELQKQLDDVTADRDKWKGHAQTWETRSKENLEKAKRLDEIEEKSKTDLQKANERAEAAEKRIAERDAAEASKKLAADVAKEKSEGLEKPIPATALRGSTREELEAHADELIALLPKKPAAPTAEGQGEGERIGEGELSADDIVKAATSR